MGGNDEAGGKFANNYDNNAKAVSTSRRLL